MAKMTMKEAAERSSLLLADAREALSKVGRRNGLRHFETAQGFTQAALARLLSVTAEPIEARKVSLPASPRYSASLATGIAILGLFPVGSDVLLGIADIAERLDMSRSTAHRYVITLVALGQLEQPEGAGRKYRRPQVQMPGQSADKERPKLALVA